MLREKFTMSMEFDDVFKVIHQTGQWIQLELQIKWILQSLGTHFIFSLIFHEPAKNIRNPLKNLEIQSI